MRKESDANTKTYVENLIHKTLEEICLYLEKQYDELVIKKNKLGEPKSHIEKLLWWNRRKKISKLIYILMHLKPIMQEAYNFSYDIYRKRGYINDFFKFENNIDKYNNVYSYLSDEDSKKLFDYLLKLRIAYTFVGEEANKIFPIDIIKDIEGNRVDGVAPQKVKGNLYKVKNYLIKTTQGVIFGAWYEGQYFYKNICCPQKGDVVLSCGAFMGETSIWFADKVGASGKVYAFEPAKGMYQLLGQLLCSVQAGRNGISCSRIYI